MNKFGSYFDYFILVYSIIWILIQILILYFVGFNLSYFLTTIVITLIGTLDLYYGFNGLIINDRTLILCNTFTPEKFRILFEEIKRVELVTAFRNAYIEIYTKNHELKKYFLRGFSDKDLRKWVDIFQELEINAEFIDRS